jgi:ankyrin repeat protein
VKLLTIILSILLTFSSCTNREELVDKSKLLGNDYRLFQSTPAWELAKAVWDEDIPRIEQIVSENRELIDYQEERLGKTLLMFSIANQDYESFKTLVELGADLSVHNSYRGSTAIMYSVEVRDIPDNELKYLTFLLEHGANPNDMEVGERTEDNTTRDTPLMIACGRNKQAITPLPLVKALVDAGADIDKGDEFGRTPLSQSFFQDNFDVLIYLLTKGANHRVPIFIDPKGEKFYLEHMFKRELFPLGSEECRQKMEIVSFLESEGINYSEIPIPDYIKDKAKKLYPKEWKEYLKKY